MIVLTARGAPSPIALPGWTSAPTTISEKPFADRGIAGAAACRAAPACGHCQTRRRAWESSCSTFTDRASERRRATACPAAARAAGAGNACCGGGGRAVARPALEDAVYSIDDEIQSNTLDAHISRLRRKLGGCSRPASKSTASAASATCCRCRYDPLANPPANPRGSLKWQLINRLLGLQAAMLVLLVLLVVGCAVGYACYLVSLELEDDILDALLKPVGCASARPARADAQGHAGTRRTAAAADAGLVVHRPGPRRPFAVAGGTVPRWPMPRIGDALDDISQARLGWMIARPAVLADGADEMDRDAGRLRLQILTGSWAAQVSWL